MVRKIDENNRITIPKEILKSLGLDVGSQLILSVKDGNIVLTNYDRKNEIEFLRERENKLQLIEQMFKSGIIDLSELNEIVNNK